MKRDVKVALVQFSPWPMNEMVKNVSYIKKKIEELSTKGNDLIVFPEMSITNFFEHGSNSRQTYWKKGSLPLDDPLISEIVTCVKQNNCYTVVGFSERSDYVGKMYNSAVLIGPEGIIGVTRKIHFPGLEKLYFSPGEDIPIHQTPIGKIGIGICYDCFFPEYLRALALQGADIIVMCSSIWKGGEKGGIGLKDSKENFWDKLPEVSAVMHQAFVIACNGGGSHNIGESIGVWERLGMSKMVSPQGYILTKSEGNEETTLSANFKVEDLIETRSAYTFLADRLPNRYKVLIN